MPPPETKTESRGVVYLGSTKSQLQFSLNRVDVRHVIKFNDELQQVRVATGRSWERPAGVLKNPLQRFYATASGPLVAAPGSIVQESGERHKRLAEEGSAQRVEMGSTLLT